MNPNDQQPVSRGEFRAEMAAARGEFRAEMTDFRSEIRKFAADVMAQFRPLQIAVAQHTGLLAELRGQIGDVRTNMATKDEFHHRMDAFAGRLVDEDYRTAKSRTRLDEHEERIKALEKRSS